MSSRVKVAYILPFYDEGTDTHLFYNYELIKRAARLEDIFIIIEKWSTSDVSHLGARYYVQKFSFPLLRFLELFFVLLKKWREGYQNFYVHYSYYGALAAWFASLFNLSTSDVHRDVGRPKIFYWNRGMPWLFKRNFVEEAVFKFILRHTILVTGPESLVKEYAKRYGVKGYRILSNWVDVERFKPSSSPQPHILQKRDMRVLEKFGASAYTRTVLFVHHLSKRKGADLVLEIAKGFGEDVLFLMIGDGPEWANLEMYVTHPLPPPFLREGEKNRDPISVLWGGLSFAGVNIKLLGQISNSKIPEYFQAAEVFLMPSREEGSPHVLLEAMASGVPFVASDVGGVGELISKPLEELLCPAGEVPCFQSKIRKLLNDQEFYNRMRTECLSRAKNFDISKGVREFIDLFR